MKTSALAPLFKALDAVNAAAASGGTIAAADLSKLAQGLAKAYDGDLTVAKMVLFAKGLIGPTDITVTGQLTAQQSRTFLTNIFKTEFLKNVTTDAMGKLKKEGNVLGVPSRSMRRVPEGQEPTDDQKVGVDNLGYTLDAQAQQLFSDIKYSLLIDNQDNPELPSIIENAFTTQISGELVDLAWNGHGDLGADQFLGLNVGWIKLLTEYAAAARCQVVNVTPVSTGWYATIGALFDKVPTKFKSQAVAMMNTSDADLYAHERGEDAVRSDKDKSRQYIGYDILPCEFIPRNHIVVGPPKFLVFGMAKDVTRTREPHARKRVIQLTFDCSNDFAVAVPEAFVMGVPPVGP
ncbi:MAG: hypothetical protein K2X44_06255 [Magnetospirillum sp.]|nr:hypothetical protein [Magnetospirillum sp.]